MAKRIIQLVSGILLAWGLGAAMAGAVQIHSTLFYDGPWRWNEVTMESSTIGSGMHQTTTYKGTACITGYTGNATALVIPEKISWSGYVKNSDGSLSINVSYEVDVVGIGDGAFAGKSALTSVQIPACVKSIGEAAFSSCSGLTAMKIPDSVKDIARSAFHDCTGLTSVSLGSGVTNIGYLAFAYCSRLAEIKIPDSVMSIGPSAFAACSGLTAVDIPNSVKSIEMYAFKNCSGLTNVSIGEGVESIAAAAFGDCNGLTAVTILGNVTNDWSYGSYQLPFYGSTNIETVVLGEKMTKIGDYMFYGCRKLQAVTIPDGVASIGIAAFNWCNSLAEATIGNGVENIGDRAFAECNGMRRVTIGNHVDVIGGSAFYGCSSLEKVEIPDSVKSIGTEAFYRCTALLELLIGNSVVDIGTYAFSGCSSLANVTMGNSVANIGTGAFSGCYCLTAMVLPESMRGIGERAFYGCTALAAVELGGTERIGTKAFEGCTGLRAVSFPDGVRSVGAGAFSGCTALATVALPEGVEEVGAGAFSGASVKSLFFDNAEGAFLEAFSKESLRTLYLGENASGVTGARLGDCLALSSLLVAKDNGEYAVDGAGALCDKGLTRIVKYPAGLAATEYVAPATVRSVDEAAFADATALREVRFTGAVEGIGAGAFDWCIALERVSFAAGAGSVGEGAFRVCPSLAALRFEGTGGAVPEFGGSQFIYSKPVVQSEASEAARWVALCERFGMAWEAIGAEVEATSSTPVAVAYSWLKSRAAGVLAACGGDYEAAANALAANGLVVWKCYVAGLDPEDGESVFTAWISFEDGVMSLSVYPSSPDDGVARTYTVYGKRSLMEADWTDVTELPEGARKEFRFFRVGVELAGQ